MFIHNYKQIIEHNKKNEIADVSKCENYVKNNGIEYQGCYERTDICLIEDSKETGKCCSDIKDCYFKQLQQLKKENEQLKEDWYNSTKCHHLVLDECSLTGKTCKGLQECFKQAEKELLNNREEE